MVGGRERLARVLQVPPAEIERWILGEKKPPRELFLRVVDLIIEDSAGADGGAGDPPAVAQVNHGRWVAHCPFCDGAELVDLAEPLFCCLSCDNAAAGGRWLMVQFPAPVERALIEAALLARPAARNRNWAPHESVTKLVDENRQRLAGG